MKKPYKTYEETLEILKKVMDKSGAERAIEYLEKLIEYLEQEFPYDIKGASILIVSSPENFKIKLIDLASVVKYDDEAKRDEGFLLGCKNLKAELKKLHF